MNVQDVLQQLQNAPDQVQFSDVIACVDKHYDYKKTAFTNGVGDDKLHNAAGSNEGSCKIFAFAQLHNLSCDNTLQCFGDFYREDVLQHPEAQDHGNIRRFMRDGWAGIEFEQMPLQLA